VGYIMDSFALSGRSILVVEEEHNIAHELGEEFRRAGATVLSASKLRDALFMAEHPAISAAVVNVRVGDDNTNAVCRRLSYLGIPFMFHTRYDASEASEKWPAAPVMAKPADSQRVLSAVAQLLH
jgi:DNA-binding response OmpR family regulator